MANSFILCDPLPLNKRRQQVGSDHGTFVKKFGDQLWLVRISFAESHPIPSSFAIVNVEWVRFVTVGWKALAASMHGLAESGWPGATDRVVLQFETALQSVSRCSARDLLAGLERLLCLHSQNTNVQFSVNSDVLRASSATHRIVRIPVGSATRHVVDTSICTHIRPQSSQTNASRKRPSLYPARRVVIILDPQQI